MASEARRWRAERVNADAAALSEAQERLHAALARQADAERVLAEVARGVLDLRDLTESLAQRLEESRYALLRQCMASIPDDVLRCIFEEVIYADDPTAARAAHTPFTLAAVCSRWRMVALNFPAIWSYICIAPYPERVVASLKTAEARIAVLLSRSRAAPLDIFTYCVPRNGNPDGEEVQGYGRILQTLGAHVSRWRLAAIYLADQENLPAIDFLKGPTPLLEELAFTVGETWAECSVPLGTGYLPYTPRLRLLQLADAGLACSTRSAFPALTRLGLGPGACGDDDLFDYLSRAPALESLALCIPISKAPRARITLPELWELIVGYGSPVLLAGPISSQLAMPTLTHLTLDCPPEDYMIFFLDSVSPTVRSLHLTERLTVERLCIIQHLQNVEELCFLHQPQKRVEKAALEQLTCTQPPIWPHLTVLRGLTYTKGVAEHALRLLTARNPTDAAATSSAAVRPRRIQEMTFLDGAPDWLVQEIDRALRL